MFINIGSAQCQEDGLWIEGVFGTLGEAMLCGGGIIIDTVGMKSYTYEWPDKWHCVGVTLGGVEDWENRYRDDAVVVVSSDVDGKELIQ